MGGLYCIVAEMQKVSNFNFLSIRRKMFRTHPCRLLKLCSHYCWEAANIPSEEEALVVADVPPRINILKLS